MHISLVENSSVAITLEATRREFSLLLIMMMDARVSYYEPLEPT